MSETQIHGNRIQDRSIANTKLVLGTITSAEISSSAAIDVSKLDLTQADARWISKIGNDKTPYKLGVLTTSQVPQEALTIGSTGNIGFEISYPSGVTASATTGGTLVAGTYTYRVVAVDSLGNITKGSIPVSVTLTNPSLVPESVLISWSTVTGATSYRIYGRSDPQNQYWTTSSLTYTDTGTTGTSGTTPESTNAYFIKISSNNSYFYVDNFGIGTKTPTYKLHVVGTGYFTGKVIYQTYPEIETYIAPTTDVQFAPKRYVDVAGIGRLVVREIPTGPIDGTNTSFTLAYEPVNGQESVFVNGTLMDPTEDYVLVPSTGTGTITFTYAPPEGAKVRVTYIKVI